VTTDDSQKLAQQKKQRTAPMLTYKSIAISYHTSIGSTRTAHPNTHTKTILFATLSSQSSSRMIVKDMAATAVVAASAASRGIGWKGDLPWKLPGDMEHFKHLTLSTADPSKINAVVMGRKTWESIPTKFRPLSGRTNVVLTSSNAPFPPGVLVASSLADAWQQLANRDDLGAIFVIGGATVYQQAMEQNYVHKVVYTSVDTSSSPTTFEFDTFFPELSENEWTLEGDKENAETHTHEKSGLTYQFLTYTRPNHQEQQYLDLIRSIIDTGVQRGDRTGTGTLSQFGAQMRFSLRDGQLPLLTTKRTFWRGVAEELLWFISGTTNANLLAEKDIHIWDGNGSREFLDSRGLNHREQGDLGPVYGFQWRHFGAKYKDMHTDYTGQGVDQLKDCIHKIIHNPEDRRIIMSAWNPADLDEMALPPCHMFCQFYVDTAKNELSCQMYQRSADMGLGVPFNIASYALLTHMMAQVTGRKPGDFIHTIGDAHVYLNHVEPLKEQLKRTPRPFPKIKINPDKTDIDGFSMEDFQVIGYQPLKAIKMDMAV
jgi:dihydrofolate reductase/thymidylate synthase